MHILIVVFVLYLCVFVVYKLHKMCVLHLTETVTTIINTNRAQQSRGIRNLICFLYNYYTWGGGGSRHIVRFKNFSLVFRVFGSYICLISYLLYICLRYFFCMLFTFVAVVVVDKVWFDMFEVMFWGWLGGGGAQVNKIRKHLKTHQTREHTKHTCCQAFYFWWGNQDKAHYMVCLKLWAGDNAVSVCFTLIAFHKFFAYV